VNIATDAETMGELIDDCAAIPPILRSRPPVDSPFPVPYAALPWTVDERCQAQVAGLDEYV
jgi:hypothetical protein